MGSLARETQCRLRFTPTLNPEGALADLAICRVITTKSAGKRGELCPALGAMA